MNILEKIIQAKRKRITEQKKLLPLDEIQKDITQSTRDFYSAIKKEGVFPHLIAEIKQASPSEGLLREDFNPLEIAKIYFQHAHAISVITEEDFFEGNIMYLKEVSEISPLPLLRKDFIIDSYQIFESRYFGADAILLIASVLSVEEMNEYISIAKELNMDALVEIHNKDELEKVVKTEASIIGINNRNLGNFEIDLSITQTLGNEIQQKYSNQKPLIVSESGLHHYKDIESVQDTADAVLIGSTLMKSPNIRNKLLDLHFETK